jgi:PPM family protein phosphatase
MKIEYVQHTNTGLVRETNQDSILSLPEYGLFLVADGMGGEMAGDEASAQVVTTIRTMFQQFNTPPPTRPGQVEGLLTKALHQAHKDINNISRLSPEKAGMGTTASVLCLYRGVCFIAHVGDSRIYLLRGGDVRLLTRDHTLVWVLFEQGAITRPQMETHPDRHLLTQCLGGNRIVQVDASQSDIRQGDLYLICSDGLTGYAGESRVFDILQQPDEALEGKAGRLVEAALDGGGGDNISVNLARVTELEERDQWKPEDSGPLPKLQNTGRDSMIKTEFMPLPARPKTRKPIPRGLVAAAAVILVALLAFVLFQHSSARSSRIYLSGVDSAAKLDLELFKALPPLAPPVLEKDNQGTYIQAPGPGEYRLKIKRQGFANVNRLIRIARDTNSQRIQLVWTALVQLTLELPAQRQPRSVEVSASDAETDYVLKRTWDAAALAGLKSIQVMIPPDVVHTITAQGAGGDIFSARVEIPPDGSRIVRIFFQEAVKPAP